VTRLRAVALLAAGCALAAGAAGTGPFLDVNREVPPYRIAVRRARVRPPERAGNDLGLAGRAAHWVDLLLQALVFAVAAVVVAYVLWRFGRALARLMRLRFAHSAGSRATTEYDPGEGTDEDAETAFRKRVADDLTVLSAELAGEGDAREAVIACYARMERALAAAGSARHATESPLELLSRVLREQYVPESDVRRLTALFTEARFSAHPVTDDMRNAARHSLENIAGALTAVPA
jgi:hypothetical protein